jgi:hypothetical protein
VDASNLEMRLFGRFVEELELLDIPIVGRRFTWFHANGIAMSRIDRLLVSSEWLEMWGNCSIWVCPRDVSDHCPLVLKYDDNNWGPKPFRFNNFWLSHKHFNTVVEEFWRAHEGIGWMAHVLKDKLRGLKGCLKEWNSREFGSMENRIQSIVDVILSLDVKGESVGLSPVEVSRRKELFVDFWKLQKCKELSIYQRSRSKWLRIGDANSKFFHNCVVTRAKWNSISMLKVGNMWLDKPASIREAVVEFFANHYAATTSIRPNLDGVAFPMVSVEDNIMLTAPFSIEEIHLVVKESDGNKWVRMDLTSDF